MTRPYPAAPTFPGPQDDPVRGASGLLRQHLFEGRLLDAESLEAEQRYVDLRLRQPMLPWREGVLRGLGLSVPGLALPGLSWGAGGALSGGVGPEAKIRVEPGLAIDGDGEPLAVVEPTEISLGGLFSRWRSEPLEHTMNPDGQVWWARPSGARGQPLPAGAYLVVVRPDTVSSFAGLAGTIFPALVRLPGPLPTAPSVWALRSQLAASWFSALRGQAWSETVTANSALRRGAVGGPPWATPVALGLIGVGANENTLFCDPWVGRRPLVASALRGGVGRVDLALALAERAQALQMLDESYAAFPPVEGGPNLVQRGFVSLPAAGVLPVGAVPPFTPLSAARAPLLAPAYALLSGTGLRPAITLLPNTEALRLALEVGAKEGPLRFRSTTLSPGLTFAELLPVPSVRKAQGQSALGLDWGADSARALDAWQSQGLRELGLAQVVRGEVALLRLLLAPDPTTGGWALGYVRQGVTLALQPPELVIGEEEEEEDPIEEEEEEEPPWPRVWLVNPATVETLERHPPHGDVVRNAASVKVGETLAIQWDWESVLPVSRFELTIHHPGMDTNTSFDIEATARAYDWTVDPDVFSPGDSVTITIVLYDDNDRVVRCESRGLTLTEQARPEPAVLRLRVEQPTPGAEHPLTNGASYYSQSDVVINAGETITIVWNVTSSVALTRQYIQIGSTIGDQMPTEHHLPGLDERSMSWRAPDLAATDVYILVSADNTDGARAQHMVRGLTIRREQSTPSLEVQLARSGFLAHATPEVYGDGPQDLIWRVSGAQGPVEFDLRMDVPGGSPVTLATGIPGVPHADGFLWSWPQAQIAQLETGWGRTITVRARDTVTGHTATSTSAPFITVKMMGVQYIEQYPGRFWRSGYLWQHVWSSSGGRGAVEGQAPTYHCHARLTLGNPGEGGATLAQVGGDGLSQATFFLPPGTLRFGEGTRALSRRVQSDNIGLRYTVATEEGQAPLLAEPKRGLDSVRASSDYIGLLVTQIEGLGPQLTRLREGDEVFAERATRLVKEVLSVVIPWCRPCDLERHDDPLQAMTSAFCQQRGLDPLDSFEEGMSLIELIENNNPLANEMCKVWIGDPSQPVALLTEQLK
ncbi:MAG: hypothetical protein RIT28_4668, partial [Pseudomonadota bacterium]